MSPICKLVRELIAERRAEGWSERMIEEAIERVERREAGWL